MTGSTLTRAGWIITALLIVGVILICWCTNLGEA